LNLLDGGPPRSGSASRDEDLTPKRGTLMQDETNSLHGWERPGLERLKLACDVILSEGPGINDALAAELTIFRDRIECALLLPVRDR
jgi:hypothetical protein